MGKSSIARKNTFSLLPDLHHALRHPERRAKRGILRASDPRNLFFTDRFGYAAFEYACRYHRKEIFSLPLKLQKDFPRGHGMHAVPLPSGSEARLFVFASEGGEKRHRGMLSFRLQQLEFLYRGIPEKIFWHAL